MTEEHPKFKCIDCGKEDEETWFEKALDSTPENVKLIQHGTSFTNCLICDEMVCEDCQSDHAQVEAFG